MMTNLAAMNILDALDAIMDSEETKVEAVKNDFAISLDRVMKRKNITQKELSQELSVSQAYISKVLSGSTNLSIKTMVKFAGSLGAKVEVQILDEDSVSAATDWTQRVARKDKPVVAKNQGSDNVWFGLASQRTALHA